MNLVLEVAGNKFVIAFHYLLLVHPFAIHCLGSKIKYEVRNYQHFTIYKKNLNIHINSTFVFSILISIPHKLQAILPFFLTCFCKWNCQRRPLNFAFLELSRGLFHLGLFSSSGDPLSCVKNMYANQIPVVTEWCQKHCHHLQHIWHIFTTHFYIRRWWWKSERSTP